MREDAAAFLVPTSFPGHSNFSDSSLTSVGLCISCFLTSKTMVCMQVAGIILQTKGWELEKLMASQIMLWGSSPSPSSSDLGSKQQAYGSGSGFCTSVTSPMGTWGW